MTEVSGRVPSAPGSHPSGHAGCAVDGASRFDPSRWLETRDAIARIIRRELVDDIQDAYNPERGTKTPDVLAIGCEKVGYVDAEDAAQQFAYLTADAIMAYLRDSDRSGEAGETRRGSTEGESAGPEGASPNPLNQNESQDR